MRTACAPSQHLLFVNAALAHILSQAFGTLGACDLHLSRRFVVFAARFHLRKAADGQLFKAVAVTSDQTRPIQLPDKEIRSL